MYINANKLRMNKIISGQNSLLSENEKEEMKLKAEKAYGEFLSALGYDWENDPNMQRTPHRVAKMMVYEITKGTYSDPPTITTFPNVNKYPGMVFEGNIGVKSLCSHHILPFHGKAYVAYIPGENGKLIGLSKLNRIVQWFMRRPQLQEALTMQIHNYISELLGENKGVAVMIKADHMCVALRGAEDDSTMCTAEVSGMFYSNEIGSRDEFYKLVENCKK